MERCPGRSHPARRPRLRRRRRRAPLRPPRAGGPERRARKHPVIAVDMQPVPVTVASSSCPFATATTRSPSETWSTGPVTATTQPSVEAAAFASSAPESSRADRLDPADLRLPPRERRDLRRIAANDRDLGLGEQSLRRLGAELRRPGADRIEHDGHARPVRGLRGEQHRLDPVLRKRSDVEHERPGDRRPAPRPPRPRAPSRAGRRARASRSPSRS